MPELHYWHPGRPWRAVVPGETWYQQSDDTFTCMVLISGYYGTYRKDRERYGSWDEDEDQLWTVRIAKSLTYDWGHGPEIVDPYWTWMRIELGDKTHRSLSTGLCEGEFVSRVPVSTLGDVRVLTDRHRLVWTATARDRRAVRQYHQRQLRNVVRQQRQGRRDRNGASRQYWEKNWPGDRRWRRRMDAMWNRRMNA